MLNRETLSSPSGEDSPYRPRERTHHTVLVQELTSIPQAYQSLLDFTRGFANKNTRNKENT
jgi:hypothetical protein